MKTFILLSFIAVLSSANPLADVEEFDNSFNSSNRTVHLYVLLVPDSAAQELIKERARQDEDGGVVSETGAYVGQIISGVLGGDVRPIFAGSASFIGETDVQQGVSTILANVAPSINNVLKMWVNRAQTFFGISSTPRPGTNGTRFANGTQSNQTLSGTNLLGLQFPVTAKPDEDEEESGVFKSVAETP